MKQDELKELYPKMPDRFKNVVDNAVSEKMNSKGKVIIMKKKLLAALVATLAIGVTAIGAGKAVGVMGNSNVNSNFTDVNEIKDKADDMGYDFKYVEKFDNGYTFSNGYTGTSSDIDENFEKLNEFNNISLVYKGDKGDVIISVDKYRNVDGVEREEGVIEEREDIYKWCPPDYEMTEQDKIDSESGKYTFSFGIDGDEVIEEVVRSVSWYEDDAEYVILQYGNSGSLTIDELTEMAEQIQEA